MPLVLRERGTRRGAEKSSIYRKDRFLDYAVCDRYARNDSGLGLTIRVCGTIIVKVHTRSTPKAARQEGSLVRCHFDHCCLIVLCHFDRSAEVLGAERRNLLYTEKRFLDCARNDGIRYYLFGCNAKPSTQPTHGSRQAFGLHSACAKPLACRRKVIPARVALISTHAKSDATRAAFNPNYFSPYTYRRPTKSTFCAAPRPPVRAGARTPSGGAR